ncbi:MAG: RluA family pseudouridine synthase [Desulfocapsa sp.]|nr:RluA family pseudouridine synthase [Desulfocapsa sp.]
MEFSITKDFHNVRLDNFLRKNYREIPLTGIFRMIRKGKVKVNRKKKKQDYRLQEGDLVRVWDPSPPTAAKALLQLTDDEKNRINQTIVYENDRLIFCNKPAGLVMHSGSSHTHGLTELIQAHIQNRTFSFVHRIDKMTSGLVMGAKDPATARELSELIREQKIQKYYLVLVEGVLEKGKNHFSLNTFLKKEHDRVIEHPNEERGAKKASSEFSVLERGPKRTLLEARLHTGKTHQLRVQLANIRHPIVGDGKYGRQRKTKTMFLFSQRIVIPSLNIDFSLPVPELFYSALKKL